MLLRSIRIPDVSSSSSCRIFIVVCLLIVELSLGWNRGKNGHWTHIYSFFSFCASVIFPSFICFVSFLFSTSKFSMTSSPVLSFNGLSLSRSVVHAKKNHPPSEKCEPINCVFSLFCNFFPFFPFALYSFWAIFILCAQEILHWVVSRLNVWVKCYLS